MRVILRTSGGRGEYEIAGSQGGIGLTDLIGKRIIVQIVPEFQFDSGCELQRKDGKPRIRRAEPWGKHIYLTLSAILLLPNPIRELGKTVGGGRLQIREKTFSITIINFIVSRITEEQVIIEPTELVLQNYETLSAKVDFAERLNFVFQLWRSARNTSDVNNPFRSLVIEHEQQVITGQLSGIQQAADNIRRAVHSEEDPLKQFCRSFAINDESTYSPGIHYEFVDIGEEDQRTEIEAKIEIQRKWRLLADRGIAGEKFKKAVREAYGFKCLFTGLYLPNTTLSRIPGVDSAHILPWSIYNINNIVNGICINKLCHWGFDNGILRLEFNSSIKQYTLLIPEAFQKLHSENKIDLTYFLQIQGVIPKKNLPSNELLWPDQQNLKKLNESWGY